LIYQFKRGARIPSGANATEVAEALQDISSRYGELSTKTVADDVEADSDHVLAPWFTWDGEIAVRKLHEIEAGNLIRSVSVRQLKPTHEVPIRAFVLSGIDYGYEHVASVLKDKTKRESLIADILEEKRQVDDKFAELIELIGLL